MPDKKEEKITLELRIKALQLQANKASELENEVRELKKTLALGDKKNDELREKVGTLESRVKTLEPYSKIEELYRKYENLSDDNVVLDTNTGKVVFRIEHSFHPDPYTESVQIKIDAGQISGKMKIADFESIVSYLPALVKNAKELREIIPQIERIIEPIMKLKS